MGGLAGMPGRARAGAMRFSAPLIPGRLVRRYKRFLADVVLEDGRAVTAHVANTGSLMGLCAPGLKVFVEPSDNPKRKLPFTWRAVELEPGGPADPGLGAPVMVGIDTSVPNRVVGEALAAGRVPGLAAYPTIRREVRYGVGSRVDFLLQGDGLPDAYVEVKNVHLLRHPGLIEFPDSVTSRGAKHLDELAAMVAAGHRAIMLYCLQRGDGDRMALAPELDPAYVAAYERARAAGVEAEAWVCRVTTDGIDLARRIPIAEA